LPMNERPTLLANLLLGTVQAPDERTVEAAAVAQFGLDDDQRKQLAVREEEVTPSEWQQEIRMQSSENSTGVRPWVAQVFANDPKLERFQRALEVIANLEPHLNGMAPDQALAVLRKVTNSRARGA
jgi:hypothetical protein